MSRFNDLKDLGRSSGRFSIRAGLRGSQFRAIQDRFGVRFPPDLAELLEWGVPSGHRFPDWKRATGADAAAREAARDIEKQLAWPLKGMLFDITHGSFWDPGWGEKPPDLAESCRVATAAFEAAPRLIPVYGHRYLPAEPCEAGNPVLSVHQMDIIIYGENLEDYFAQEFGHATAHDMARAREIRCWTRWMRIGRG